MRPILFLLAGVTAYAQQVSFTSRTYVQSPVAILAVEQSNQFGFSAITLRNDAAHAITAVHFQIMFRTGAGDEVAGDRRVPVNIGLRDTRHFAIELGQIDGLRQLARSRGQSNALVILTIESLEFADGSEWKESERDQGAPIDPLVPIQIRREPTK